MLLLAEISRQGEKYLDKQIETAINGVQEMKNVMQKSTEEHQKYLDALEKTKQLKEVRYDKAVFHGFVKHKTCRPELNCQKNN